MAAGSTAGPDRLRVIDESPSDLTAVIQEAYVPGASIRSVDDLAEALGMGGIDLLISALRPSPREGLPN